MAETTRTRSARETELLERAKRRLPGGVLGTARYAADAAFVVKHGTGSKIYDVSGREYLDYVLASGPLILGHAHPAVVAAVRAQIEGGSTYFMVNEPIIQLAEEICRAMPCAEQVRFTSTGSEATFFALRVARTVRKRDKILKFEGGYHGAHDYGMMSSAPRSPKAFPAPVPDSSGIPHSIEAEVLIAPYNDLGTVEGIVAAHPGQRVVVVTHAGAINAYLSMVLDIDRDMFFFPEHASVSSVRVMRDLYSVRDINDRAHLLPSFAPR